MSRYIGNYLRVPSSEPQQSSAPGIWSLSDQLAYQRANLWPPARDPYYNQTVLHLTGNIPNTSGPQAMNVPLAYNSDASSNNHLITPNGDVSPRPFSPYMGSNYSVYFPGSTARIQFPSGNIIPSSGTYTIECWIYPTSLNATYGAIIASQGTTPSGDNGRTAFSITAAGILTFGIGESFPSFNSGSTIIKLNQWTHVAITRNNTIFTMYINGNRINQVTSSKTTDAGFLRLGTLWDGDGNGLVPYVGYISNFRIVYSVLTDFTNRTDPLTPITNTALLACQSNRFIDNSTNNYSATVVGGATVTDNSPFVSTDFTTGAGYFDGNGDYLSVADNAAFTLGTNAFTAEAWVYPTTSGSAKMIMGQYEDTDNTGSFLLYINSGGKLICIIPALSITITGATTVPVNAWSHVVITRSGSSFAIFLNGSRDASPATNSGSLTDSTYAFTLGADRNGDNLLYTGYISNARLVNGTAVYDPSLTTLTNTITGATGVPTAPLQPITNTSLLTLQTRAASQNIGFIDSSPNEFIVTKNGNTTQGTFSPFSPTGWGNYFAGPTNYFSFSSSLFALGTDGFTIDGWIYLTAYSYSAIFSTWLSAFSSNNGIMLGTNSSGNLELNIGNAAGGGSQNVVSASVIPLNTWVFIQGTKAAGSGGVMKIYINGNDVTPSTVTTTRSVNLTSGVVGRYYVDSSAHGINGYISNVRVSNTVRSSTVPTAPFSVDANTVFLSCQANRFRDAGPGNVSLTVNGTPSVQAFSPFAPATQSSPLVTGGSAYFDGNDYLTVPASNIFDFAAGQAFTFECWVYTTNTSNVSITQGGGNTFQLAIYPTTSIVSYGKAGVADIINGSTTININAWNHILVARNTNNQSRLWFNGISIGSSTGDSYAFNNAVQYIGSNANPGSYLTGYLSAVRILKNTALYDPTSASNIPVPTIPPTSIPNTSLLLNFTSGGIVDATGKNVLETVGNAQVATAQSKWAPGSVYFDGTGDYLVVPSSTMHLFGTQAFTVEAWVYTTATKQYQHIYGTHNSDTNWLVRLLDNKVMMYTGSADITGSTVLSVNTWYHIAVVREGTGTNQTKLYVNGNLDTTGTNSTNYTIQSQAWIGAQINNPGITYFQGYIDDLRISRFARYTGNFNITTAPAPFPIG